MKIMVGVERFEEREKQSGAAAKRMNGSRRGARGALLARISTFNGCAANAI